MIVSGSETLTKLRDSFQKFSNVISLCHRMLHIVTRFAFSFILPYIIIDCGFILFSLINSHISTKSIQRLLVTIIDYCGKNNVNRSQEDY